MRDKSVVLKIDTDITKVKNMNRSLILEKTKVFSVALIVYIREE
jgi:hypothetical protein